MNTYFIFECYTKNPKTKECGWDIKFIGAKGTDVNSAKKELEKYPLFDVVILLEKVLEYENNDDLIFVDSDFNVEEVFNV